MTGPDVAHLWPMAVYFIAVVSLVAAMLGLSYFLGQRHRERSTNEPYESGIIPTGPSQARIHVRFYLVAMLFVIFDVEAVFVFAWAAALREAGWAGYIEMLIFIFILFAALFYLWRMGALDWGTEGLKKIKIKGKDNSSYGTSFR